ncbi:MAG TPA: tetratricopeptide repeat protein [Terriglobales bacterium]|jgi:diguanylate cyclase (GGDEF)-like protein|nr:tetratricopeptide repeat protein [Terriglobales bacterium]
MAELTKRLDKAEKLFQKGKHDAALEEYLAVLAEEPTNDAARQKAADLCVSLNRPGEAATLLGVLFERQASVGDLAKAVITYKKLARVGAPNVDQTFLFARLTEKSSRKDALEAFEAAVVGYISAGRKHDARAAMERIVVLEPSVSNLRRLGELHAGLGDNKSAALAFFQAGELDRKAGGDGLTWYQRAFALDPANPGVVLACAEAQLATGDAAAAISTVEPLATVPGGSPELRDVYGRALLAANRPLDAGPYIWELFQRDPRQFDEVMRLIAALIGAEQYERALALTRDLASHQYKAGRRREFVLAIKEITDQHPPGLEFLEYLVELYNNNSREYDYSAALLRLFDLYFAAGNFLKAGDALDRAAEVDPYEPGHQQRLEMLRGRIDQHFFDTIAQRLKSGVTEPEPSLPEVATRETQPTILEDFMLQAEIFLQYSMRSKALERLTRINKLFPHEEENNEKLYELFEAAAFIPEYGRSAAPRRAAASSAGPAIPSPGGPQAAPQESAADSLERVSEITRNIYRQGNVKSVLFTAVNEVGRHWGVSRCVAAMCTPGKPPSAALEYCAPQVKQSDIQAIVKLIGALQAVAIERGVVHLPHALGAPELASIQELLGALGIESLLAVPLLDGEEHLGILILEHCGTPRQWRTADITLLRSIADHVVQAFHGARLRSLVRTLAVTEEKSGLLKRSSYIDVLTSEVRRAQQQSSPAALLLLNFGKAAVLVKEYGEAAVNDMMRNVGQVLCSCVRQSDTAVRYDLTTVAVSLSDTNEHNALLAAEKMRRVLGSVRLPGTDQPVTVTAGIAEAVIDPKYDAIDNVTELMNRAEYALEIAEGEGGNKSHALPPQLQMATAGQ